MEITRRELLKILGVSGGAAAAGFWGARSVLSVPDSIFERIVDGPRLETWKNSVCTVCPGGCGIRVRLIDGIPVRITGNALHPINRGAVCPMAEAGVEELFHPARIRGPLRRVGNRGDNQWQVISWEEALQVVSERLRSLREAGTPSRLAVLRRNTSEVIDSLIAHFMQAFGSPNLFSLSDAEISSLPVRLTQGLTSCPAYDFANADFVLNFGADFLDEPPSPVRFNQLYAQLRSRRDRSRGEIIHIGSNMSRTAANSLEWVPVEPGSMGALALSIAYVMIRDNSYDHDFIENRSFGFSNWKDSTGEEHQGFRSLVLGCYYPEGIEAQTGVPALKIVELARRFATAKSALAVPGSQAVFSTNGLYTSWAIYCLNALKGNLEKPGGVLFPSEMIPVSLPPLKAHGMADANQKLTGIGSSPEVQFSLGVESLSRLAAAFAKQDDEIDTLIIHRINPLLESIDPEKFATSLKCLPFIISCSPFLDETSVYADLILPEPVFLERWEASSRNPSAEFRHFTVQQPVIKPLYENLHFGDVLLRISPQIGSALGEALPWDDYESYLKEHGRAIFDSGEGTIVSEDVQYSWIEFLRQRGWQALDYSNSDEFWDLLLEQGGWWDPNYPEPNDRRILQTPSRKFEFYSQLFHAEVERLTKNPGSVQIEDLRRSRKIDANGDQIYLPHFEPQRFSKEGIDSLYCLITYQQLSGISRAGGHLTLLRELAGLYSRQYWQSWVEINPETAERLGILDDDEVIISSRRGALITKAKILPTVMPQVVVMPLGSGDRLFRQEGHPVQLNPYDIMEEDSDLITRVPSLFSTRVRIEKVGKKV